VTFFVSQNSIYNVTYIGNESLPIGPNPFVYTPPNPPTPPVPPAPTPDSSSNAWIWIVIVCIVVVVAIAGVAYFCWKKRSATQQKDARESYKVNNSDTEGLTGRINLTEVTANNTTTLISQGPGDEL
jgi:uncharacterized protein HemX